MDMETVLRRLHFIDNRAIIYWYSPKLSVPAQLGKLHHVNFNNLERSQYVIEKSCGAISSIEVEIFLPPKTSLLSLPLPAAYLASLLYIHTRYLNGH
jgi:hypothetical protein